MTNNKRRHKPKPTPNPSDGQPYTDVPDISWTPIVIVVFTLLGAAFLFAGWSG